MNRSCKILLFLLPILSLSYSLKAQSKLTEAKQSAITGLDLPAGSKMDKRTLSVASANILLEMVSKKAGVSLSNTEVFYLLPQSADQFTGDTFTMKMQQLGWIVKSVEGEPGYYWLEQKDRYAIAYAAATKKATNLCFSIASQTPQTPSDQADQQPTTQQNTIQNPTEQTIQPQQQHSPVNNNNPVVNNSYAFTTTNFDDGWKSTVQQEWVEVAKGNIRVLLHYPKDGTIIPADPEPHVNNAWNILVAHRYSNLTNYRTSYITDYNRPYLGMGTATDNSTGIRSFIVLFRRGNQDG